MAQKPIHPDQKYVQALVENDQVLIREIYDRFSKGIIRWINKNSGDESDAQDVFQETLITIFRQAKNEGLMLSCPFEPYLLLLCKRKWYNELKKRKRGGVTLEGDFTFKDEADENALELAERCLQDEERRELFWNKFSDLGPRCKELLKKSWSGLSMEQVSTEMSVSYAYSRKKKSECIARLMDLVKKDPGFKGLAGA